MKSAVLPAMSPITAAEASLINDVEFLEELEQSEHVNERTADSGFWAPKYADAFDGLESGLPTDSTAHRIVEPQDEPTPIDESPELPSPAGRQIPFLAAALVLVACLTAGAVTAAMLFHDRLTQIAAVRPASR